MFTNVQGNSCISFGIINRCNQSEIITSICKLTDLVPFKDVIIVHQSIINTEVYDNALLFVDLFYRSTGIPIFCDICSARINTIITDLDAFLINMARNLNSNIFFESNDVGYLIDTKGGMQKKKYTEEFINDVSCIIIDTD
jgi:hypothetical protein